MQIVTKREIGCFFFTNISQNKPSKKKMLQDKETDAIDW